ncbi:MAG: 3-keto-5-aminohexanoate cleavage protein, partial [Smithellaceae bacterium]|nr:3-keto-5-aminohexanoate cleavage protein [Smithellaceae bacterium]
LRDFLVGGGRLGSTTKKRKEKNTMAKDATNPVIICAALTGADTMKNNNPSVPYTIRELATEANKCIKAGAAMVHVHARTDDGQSTHEIDRVQAIYDAIKEKSPELIICLSSAVGVFKTAEQRIAQILAVRPEMASYNTNTMNFSIVDRNTGQIFFDYVFENTFQMLQDFGKGMEEKKIKPEIECYDIGGMDNTMLMAKQGFFSAPMNFNFVWGVVGGQKFRPDVMVAMKNALPENAHFTTCAVGIEQFPANVMSCLLGGNMRVGMEDNTRMPNGELAKGSYEQVEWCAKVAESLGRPIATPAEARKIMGIRKK